MARDSGQRNGARAGLLGNMASKHAKESVAEIKQNKIEQVLAYRAQVPRCGRVLESFLTYSDKLLFINKINVTGPAFHRCLFSKLGSCNAALHYRGLKSKICIPNRFWPAIADNIIGIPQMPRSLEEKHRMMYYLSNFHVQCWFLRPANCLQKQFRVAQNTDIWSYKRRNAPSWLA